VETLQKAFEDLMAALQTSEESNRRIIESGKAFIEKMEQLNQEMRARLEVVAPTALSPGETPASVSGEKAPSLWE